MIRKPGRKSAAELNVVHLAPRSPVAPPEPLGCLTPAQAVVWRAVVASKPPNWFTPDSWPLLAQFCRHVEAANRIAARIAQLDAEHGDALDAPEYDRLAFHRDRETKAITSLARAMRLTQGSRFRREVAGVAHERATGVPDRRPWE